MQVSHRDVEPPLGASQRLAEQRQIAAKLAAFIAENLLDEELDQRGGDPLGSDAVDSLGLEQLATYVELEFGVEVHGEDMSRRTFSSIPTLARLIDSKLQDQRA